MNFKAYYNKDKELYKVVLTRKIYTDHGYIIKDITISDFLPNIIDIIEEYDTDSIKLSVTGSLEKIYQEI